LSSSAIPKEILDTLETEEDLNALTTTETPTNRNDTNQTTPEAIRYFVNTGYTNKYVITPKKIKNKMRYWILNIYCQYSWHTCSCHDMFPTQIMQKGLCTTKLYKLWCIFNHNCTSYNLYSNNWTSYNLYDGVIFNTLIDKRNWISQWTRLKRAITGDLKNILNENENIVSPSNQNLNLLNYRRPSIIIFY
jgi:hypothetical protein